MKTLESLPNYILFLNTRFSTARVDPQDSCEWSFASGTPHVTINCAPLDASRANIYTWVFPASTDVSRGKVSVLAPIGTALLGCHALSDIAHGPRPPLGELWWLLSKS